MKFIHASILRQLNDAKYELKRYKAISESEEKYRALFQDSMEAMSLTYKGKIVDINPAWLHMHGYESPVEVIGKDVLDVICPEDRNILVRRRKEYPDARADVRKGIFQVRDICKNGTDT